MMSRPVRTQPVVVTLLVCLFVVCFASRRLVLAAVGHMVPTFTPNAALTMLARFLANKPL
jgi:hypothetical protein